MNKNEIPKQLPVDNMAIAYGKSWYFTFGSAESYPFQGGWVRVFAHDLGQAIAVFKHSYPNRSEGIVNCAFWYEDVEFYKGCMFNNIGKNGNVCHAILFAGGAMA